MKRNNYGEAPTPLTVFLPEDLKVWLKYQSVKENVSMAVLIKELLEDYRSKVEGGRSKDE